MKIGAVYPQIELHGSAEDLKRTARGCEAMGLDFLLMYDHVLGISREANGADAYYNDQDPFHDPFVAFGYLAGIVKQLRFVTGVLVLPQRQTPLVARQAADVALLSDGRVTLGVGVGWNRFEYAALGQPFEVRGKRLDEQIPLLRRLWQGGIVDHEGTFETIRHAALCPTPKQPIGILLGGGSRPAFARAARLGDGFVFGGARIATIIEQWRDMRTLLAEHGRDVPAFQAYALIMNEETKALPAQEAADAIRVWRDAGGTHAGIVSMGARLSGSEQHIDYFADVLNRTR